MSEIESRIIELEGKREWAWKLYMYYCEKLAELREPDKPISQERASEIARMIGMKAKIRQKIEEKKNKPRYKPPEPRYDDVYWEGVEQLDRG